MTSIRLFDRVLIITDRFGADAVHRGTEGYVIEDHGDGNFEVEISDPNTGETLATVVATAEDLENVA